jgi:hypothetical protein
MGPLSVPWFAFKGREHGSFFSITTVEKVRFLRTRHLPLGAHASQRQVLYFFKMAE